MTDAPRVFRAPMRSRSDDVDAGAAVERALTRSLCGLGGALHPPPASIADAAEAAAVQHDERLARRIGRFAAVPDGAFVWTRDAHGLFWLGRLVGPWSYDGTPDAVAVDLVHVRPCVWLDAPTAENRVPARVRLAFARGGRNWQEIHADAAATAGLWPG